MRWRALACGFALMLWAQAARAQVTNVPQNWQEDLRFISDVLPTLHPNLYFQVSRSDFQAAAAALHQEIPALTDPQIMVRLAALVALIGDAHTNLFLTQAAAGFRTYPIRLQWFDDGLFVVAALPGYERSIGTRLVSIAGVDIGDAYNRVTPTVSAENEPWRRRISQDYLVIPELIQSLGISSGGTTDFLFQDSTGSAFALTLNPFHAADARSWIYVPDLTTEAVPLYRKQNNQNYWFQYLSESRTLYFKYNVCNNAPFLAFSDFTAEFLRVVDDYPIERFVLDVRNNTGGNSALIQPLLTGLQQRYLAGSLSPDVRLFVIIGAETFSSALLNALQLKEAPQTTLVGQPTGGKPNHYGNVVSVALPRSGLRLSYSTRFFASPVTTASLEPDVAVPLTSAAYFSNRDAALEAALEGRSPATSVAPFVMYAGGGSRIQSRGDGSAVRAGYATLSSRTNHPFGFGVVQLRQGGMVTSEATVTPSSPLTSAITYAEVEGRVNTGIAIANVSSSEAVVSFEVRNDAGLVVAARELRLAAGVQLARFLTEDPFNVSALNGGSLRINSTVPISVLALRGYANERGDFLLSTLAVTESSAGTSTIYCAQVANGEGWTTQINLVNASNQPATGSFEFVPGGRQTYSLPPYGARRFRTDGAGSLTTGFVRVIPDAGTLVPVSTALFGYSRNGVTVTEASVHGTASSSTHTMVVSASGGFAVAGPNAVMSGVALANGNAGPATVQLSLTTLAGGVLGSTTIQIPANGHRSLFLDELFAGSVTMPYEATLRLTSSQAIAVTGLRGQYNARGDFLISATPEFEPSPGSIFTHIVDGGGYSTRFLFITRDGGIGGLLRLVGQDGSPLAIELRE